MTPEQKRAIALAQARKRQAAAAAAAGSPDQARSTFENPTGLAGVLRSISDPLGRFNRSFTNGYTLGLADEIEGAADAAMTGQGYGEAVGAARQRASEAAAEMPIISAIGAGLGGISSGVNIARGLGIGSGAGLGGQAVHGAKLGAVEGGIYGFNDGEGGAGDRVISSMTNAALGGSVGAAAPAAVSGAGKLFGSVFGNPLSAMRSAPDQVRASRAVEQAVSRSGQSKDQIRQSIIDALAAGQPGYSIADAAGYSGQRMLAGAARTPGSAREEIAQYLMSRQDGQGSRIAGALDDAMNAPSGLGVLPTVPGQAVPNDYRGMTAQQVGDRLTEARGAAAGRDYAAARGGAGPVDVRGVIAALDDRLGPMTGADVTGDSIDAAYSQIRRRLAGQTPDGAAAELSDFDRVLGVKQDVQDMIGRAQRSGEGNRVRELSKIVREIDAALEASSAGYRQANDSFATASRVIDQLDAGRAATSPRSRSADVTAEYAALTPDQQAAYRAGYTDPLMARIEGAAPGVNKARPLLDDATQAELGAMARKPQDLAEFLRREDRMFRTGNAALGGSMTADNLADVADVSALNANTVVNVLTGRWGAAATQLGDAALNALMGRNTATRDEIARLLLSGDIDAALAPAAQRAGVNSARSAVLEALIRSGERSIEYGQ